MKAPLSEKAQKIIEENNDSALEIVKKVNNIITDANKKFKIRKASRYKIPLE